ncbi:MAG: hypothetical protein ACXWB9_04310 [Flavisolibacter sp.]
MVKNVPAKIEALNSHVNSLLDETDVLLNELEPGFSFTVNAMQTPVHATSH